MIFCAVRYSICGLAQWPLMSWHPAIAGAVGKLNIMLNMNAMVRNQDIFRFFRKILPPIIEFFISVVSCLPPFLINLISIKNMFRIETLCGRWSHYATSLGKKISFGHW